MGYYKSIKKQLPPVKFLTKEELENIIRDISDENDCFENMVFEYGIKCFTKRFMANRRKKTTVPAFIEIEEGKYIDNPLIIMNRIIATLQEYYEDMVTYCGENDEANTIPAKKAMEDANKVLSYLEKKQGL